MYLVKISIHQSSIEGEGAFAEEFIPQGTIIYFNDNNNDNSNNISPNELLFLPEEEKNKIIKYWVQDEAGNWLPLRESEEKLNHSCDANVLSLFVDGIYCEIAVKAIQEGEEITADYGLLYSSFLYRMECNCNSSICRKQITLGQQTDSQTQNLWQLRISEATGKIFDVNENLFSREDEVAKKLTLAIKSKYKPRIFPYIKFSLISEDCV